MLYYTQTHIYLMKCDLNIIMPTWVSYGRSLGVLKKKQNTEMNKK